MFDVKILADSVSPAKTRLTTFEATYPRFIHSELMTHRVFSRNSASSRAIPISKMLSNIENNPVIPINIGANQSGMQAGEEIADKDKAIKAILDLRDAAVATARYLAALGCHKQVVNRYLEPWMWITVIVSTTSFEHFKRLRVSPEAEPHFQKLSGMLRDARDHNTPVSLADGEWHLPLIREEDMDLPLDVKIKVSTARCARVSYLTHNGVRDIEEDIKLHDRLLSSGHWSPFEHPAKATINPGWRGNFQGFVQYRKLCPNEFIAD